jgi:hypothetical protein
MLKDYYIWILEQEDWEVDQEIDGSTISTNLSMPMIYQLGTVQAVSTLWNKCKLFIFLTWICFIRGCKVSVYCHRLQRDRLPFLRLRPACGCWGNDLPPPFLLRLLSACSWFLPSPSVLRLLSTCCGRDYGVASSSSLCWFLINQSSSYLLYCLI